jgi:hypothetical protein
MQLLRETNKHFLFIAIMLLAAVMIFACGCGETEDDDDDDSTIYIWPSSLNISIGEKAYFQVVEVDDEGETTAVSASYSVTGSIGSIDSTGCFSAEAVGTGKVIGVYDDKSVSSSVTVSGESN